VNNAPKENWGSSELNAAPSATWSTAMNRKVRVLIADDHPIFRQGLRQIIDTAPQLEVVCD
jgi:hypothetical protein